MAGKAPGAGRAVLRASVCVTFVFACASCGGGGQSAGPASPPLNSGLDSRPANATCVAPPEPGVASSVASTRVFANLSFQSPVLMIQAPGDSTRWYVVEQRGVIRTFANDNATAAVGTFLDLQSRVHSGGEAGLLGMAFDPGFAANGRVYLSYTADPTVSGAALESRISRFTLAGGVPDPASEEILLTLAQPYENHNGGNIAFGPDGFLYAGFGDGGSGGDPLGNGQNRSTLLGKLVRIDVSAGGAYTIPATNPFAGGTRCATGTAAGGGLCQEIYAYGLRNPWRWSFDRSASTPDIWLADVGQSAWEEVDRIEAGGNYGWNVREGAHCYPPSVSSCPATGNGVPLIDPVAEYSHDLGVSVTGGYVYRGASVPALAGRYVFGDFGSGRIFALLPDASGALQRTEVLSSGAQISSFAQANDGELYYLDYGSGAVFRIVAGSGASSGSIPTLLSQTGCVNANDATQPAPGLIPYAPNAPFWSDGAVKTRWLAVPDGQKITVDPATGDFDFPKGTVLVKSFVLNGQRIETRLFMRHTDTGNWRGYTYRWNDARTDATLVSGGLVATVAGQDWVYPSETQCLQCHTAAAGSSLGLETRQINSTMTYPATGRSANQLDTLEAIGMFTASPARLTAMPDPADTSQPLAERARAYLHTNCSQCHRPGGGTPVTLDLRYTTPVGQTNACNVTPASGDLGVSGARVITPGEAASSVLYLRMSRRDASQMPPLGSLHVDTAGAALIQQWIAAMGPACQ